MPYISVSPYHPLPFASAVRPTLAASSTSQYPPYSDYLSIFRSAVFSFTRRPKPSPSRFPLSSPLSHSRTAAATRCFLRHLFRPTTTSYNALINSLLLANHNVAASAAFSSFLSSGLPLSTSSFTVFFKILFSSSRPNRFDSAYSLLDKLLQYGPPPNAAAYSTFICALSRSGRIREAVRILDLMLDNKCCPTPQACNSLIHGYCSQGKIKEAKHFVSLMECHGIPPNTSMYTILIDALSKNGEFDVVETILKESHVKGWKPDEVTYNVYMNGLCKAGRIDKAFGILDVMRCNGLLPTLDTLNILFDCLCRDSMLQEAMDLLRKSSELDWFPDVVFYNTLLSRCLEFNCPLNVFQLFSNMVKRGIEPDACTLTLLIRAIFKARKLHLARCMIDSTWNFVPDVVAFNTVLHQLYLLGENKEVIIGFTEMIRKSVAPNKFTFYVVIDSLFKEGRVEEAIELILGTVKEDFVHDLISRLLRWLTGRRKLGQILKLFDKLGQNSVIHVANVNSLIFFCCRTGLCRRKDFYRLSILIDKVLEVM